MHTEFVREVTVSYTGPRRKSVTIQSDRDAAHFIRKMLGNTMPNREHFAVILSIKICPPSPPLIRTGAISMEKAENVPWPIVFLIAREACHEPQAKSCFANMVALSTSRAGEWLPKHETGREKWMHSKLTVHTSTHHSANSWL